MMMMMMMMIEICRFDKCNLRRRLRPSCQSIRLKNVFREIMPGYRENLNYLTDPKPLKVI